MWLDQNFYKAFRYLPLKDSKIIIRMIALLLAEIFNFLNYVKRRRKKRISRSFKVSN